ncbi:putative ATP-dependent RNA helicase DHX35 [Galemys pyrenaicus]|uniref:RNA helicase n=1 Tax=Galemys pyrenaicus TaxID=202257 RepID=A0A8J6A7Y6_GALPY|nr:putative ATP-dependent RNA helicase DHX35 [Galemys pyrenaicus]
MGCKTARLVGGIGTYPMFLFSPVPDYIKSTVETVMKIHQTEGDGDILAFLTGQEEVETVVSMLIEQARALGRTGMKRHLRVLPMYAGLPSFEQMKVFERVSRSVRKVIVATNVAETSITISGIVFVIDCGFMKLRAYNPRTAIECLVVVPVSQASANQRAGRGGRNRSGKCYRLYTEEAFDKLPQSTVPELQRSNLAPVILQLKALGVDSVLRVHFMSPPPAQSMVQALELLYALGGLDKDCRLTEPLGRRIAEFPLNPMFAKMLLESGNFGCSQEILSIAAMMQIQNIFVVPSSQKSHAIRMHRKFAVEEGDHLTMLNVYEAFIKHNKNSQWCQEHFLNYKGLVRAATVREQLKKLLVKFQVPKKSSEGKETVPRALLLPCAGDPDPVLRCIVAGFFANAARFHSTGAYRYLVPELLCFSRTIRDDHELHIHPASVLYAEKPPRWVIYNEVVQTSKYYMRDVTAVESAWLLELAPHFYQQGTSTALACPRRLHLLSALPCQPQTPGDAIPRGVSGRPRSGRLQHVWVSGVSAARLSWAPAQRVRFWLQKADAVLALPDLSGGRSAPRDRGGVSVPPLACPAPVRDAGDTDTFPDEPRDPEWMTATEAGKREPGEPDLTAPLAGGGGLRGGLRGGFRLLNWVVEGCRVAAG